MFNENSNIFKLIGGSAPKKYSGKKILFLAVATWSFTLFITPFISHSFFTLLFARVALGFGEGLGGLQVIVIIIIWLFLN